MPPRDKRHRRADLVRRFSAVRPDISTNGSRDSGGGETSFAPRPSLLVSDLFNLMQTALFSHGDNSFRVAPEPGTLALLGLGLAGLAATRRRKLI